LQKGIESTLVQFKSGLLEKLLSEEGRGLFSIPWAFCSEHVGEKILYQQVVSNQSEHIREDGSCQGLFLSKLFLPD
jgi:hypothetical protein